MADVIFSPSFDKYSLYEVSKRSNYSNNSNNISDKKKVYSWAAEGEKKMKIDMVGWREFNIRPRTAAFSAFSLT